MSRSDELHPLVRERVEAWERSMLQELRKPRAPKHKPKEDQSGPAYPDLYQETDEPPVYDGKNEFESKQESIKEAASKVKAILKERCFNTWIDDLPGGHRESLVRALVSLITRLVYLPADIAYRGWPEYEREHIHAKNDLRKRILKRVKKWEKELQARPIGPGLDHDVLEVLNALGVLEKAASALETEPPPKGRPYADWRLWLNAFARVISLVNKQAPIKLKVSNHCASRITCKAGVCERQDMDDVRRAWSSINTPE